MHFLLKILLLFLLTFSLDAKNLLQYETSPYLLQHADNPVEWMPWGDEAFAKAKKEHKKIFLSIGYSTCHWCHVMEEESFTNTKLAKLFNKYFVCIKVDKEEMPHLDAHFQDLHQKLRGRAGGWPLSVFMDVKKNIYYISTYIPPEKRSYSEGLDSLLLKIALENKALTFQEKEPSQLKSLNIEALKKSLLDSYDEIYGGFGRTKKFPQSSKISLMYDIAQLQDDKLLYKYTYEMLDIMALRGLYDHVEGGFYRYCIDAAWEIPHFEKMLYTQAQMIGLYSEAYSKTGRELYKNIVIETVDMLKDRLTQENLFLSASDSDSENKEGHYFTFTPKEIQDALKHNKHKEEIQEQSEFSFEGNFEERVHLNFYANERPKGFYEFRKKLQKIRMKKKFPFVDTKINTAWNALSVEALFKASIIDEKYAKLAQIHLDALERMMFIKGELYHQGVLKKTPKQKGLLEDYAFFIGALLEGYEYDYEERKFQFAEYLLNQALRKFYKKGVWYASDDGLKIVADTKDKYYVSAVSKMVQNLFKLAALKESFKYEKLAKTSLERYTITLKNYLAKRPALARAYLMQEYSFVIVKASKKKLLRKKKLLKAIKYPYVLSKQKKIDDYLLCTMRRCFYKGDSIQNIENTIKLNIRK
jgi:uncharacterized protein YyaL (SSP411 family)